MLLVWFHNYISLLFPNIERSGDLYESRPSTFNIGAPPPPSQHRHTPLTVTQTGWVSRSTVLWVTGQQPVTLYRTSPDTPYLSEVDGNTKYLLSWVYYTTSCVGKYSSLSACSNVRENVYRWMYVCTLYMYAHYYCIPILIYHLTVYLCMLPPVCVHTCVPTRV